MSTKRTHLLMDIKDFDYFLPENLIAQSPLDKRDHSKLLVMNKVTGEIEHKHFFDIVDYLKKGDVLVVNNSKVIPARIFGNRDNTGGTVELLLLKDLGNNEWETLVKPGRKAKIGQVINFSDLLKATVIDILEDGKRKVKFEYSGTNLYEILDQIGNMPLPPYIKETLKDNDRYQTVYAKDRGSAAAPTAGLHFTNELLKKLEDKGVIIKYVTLHVGLGTFRPVKVENITEHIMHSESFYVPDDTIQAIQNAKKEGRRVICVGTTSVRTVESAFDYDFSVSKQSGDTSIFIYPGYKFKIPDAIITNFHLPQSTLVMLVSAFSSRDNILNAYQKAIENDYRFFSFGDAMFLN